MGFLEILYSRALQITVQPGMHDAMRGYMDYFPLSSNFIYLALYRRGFRRNFIKHCRRDLQIG
jgi:hypothetical protein